MTSLVEQLRALSRGEHSDVSVASDAADALEQVAGRLFYTSRMMTMAIDAVYPAIANSNTPLEENKS